MERKKKWQDVPLAARSAARHLGYTKLLVAVLAGLLALYAPEQLRNVDRLCELWLSSPVPQASSLRPTSGLVAE